MTALYPHFPSVPAAPTSGQTITLYECLRTSMPRTYKHPRRVVINFVSLSHASASGGLVFNVRSAGGAWRSSDANGAMPATVAATSAGIIRTYDILTAYHPEFQITYTNSASSLTSWEVTIAELFDIDPGV